jgi:murein tripeptide amidase MpaA
LAALAAAAPAASAAGQPLNAYRVKADPETLEALAQAGYDVGEGRRINGKVEIYATAGQARSLRRDGVATKVVGAARKARAAALAVPEGDDSGYDVWTRSDAVAGDGKEQYEEQYARLAAEPIVKQVSLGQTINGRDIWALKVTKDAKTTPDNTRPAVLYNAMQHAREWLAGETCRRTLDFFVDNYGRTGTAVDHNGDAIPDIAAEDVTALVDSRELWFMCVANPDGYEYTFTPGNRLWRKNLRDNNGDGQITLGDGVDPNRNYATNWGLDEEGASDNPASETYRGPGPDSEAETQAMKKLWDMVDFTFMKNDHTAAELLLWPLGFQQYTTTPDEPIFEALAGDDVDSAIADKVYDPDDEVWRITGNRFDPDLSSELYITNGDALDDAYRTHKILGYTPEGTQARNTNVSGFEFEDDEDEIELEFRRHLLFSLDLAKSAADPANPDSHMGNTAPNFRVDRFSQSWGDPQPVQATVKRELGNVTMKFRIGDGPVQTVPTTEWQGGERYGKDTGVYYHRVRGVVTGTKPGDQVRVWFTSEDGTANSPAFNYRAAQESRNPVLIMADENYTGPTPDQDPSGPKYLAYYTDALDKAHIGYDVYDVDANDTTSPDWLGVLSHYKAVIWYTGDDYVTRRPGQPGGTGTARFNLDEEVDARDYMNEGGKLFFTGQNAGRQWAEGYEVRNYGFAEPPEGGKWCSGTKPEFDKDDPGLADGCIAHNNDFLQYYLGAYVYVGGGQSTDADGNLLPMVGSGPLGGLTWSFDGTGAGNQAHSATFPVTSTILDPARFPTFASSRSIGSWLRPGAAPFDPFSGDKYAAAGADDASYKRLHQDLAVPAGGTASLTFQTSYDLEEAYDHLFVEVVELDGAGEPIDSTWTTLPDADGHATQDVGLSCPSTGDGSNWRDDHPFIDHYQTVTDNGDDCDPVGTTGDWWAATGSSGGWVDWTTDLSAYAGKSIRVNITVATDPASLGLGVWVDDAKLVVNGATVDETSFEDGLGNWTAGPPPEGTESQENGWQSSETSFIEGGVVATDDSVYTGFGFEGMNAAARPEFMRRVMAHLGVTGNPGGGPGNPGNPGNPSGPKGKVRIKSQRKLRLDRKGRVALRLRCAGETGARCSGTVRLVRRGKTAGSKRFSIRAGRTATIKVKVSKQVRKRAKRSKRGLEVSLRVSGTDTSGAKISARKTIRLLPPKGR